MTIFIGGTYSKKSHPLLSQFFAEVESGLIECVNDSCRVTSRNSCGGMIEWRLSTGEVITEEQDFDDEDCMFSNYYADVKEVAA